MYGTDAIAGVINIILKKGTAGRLADTLGQYYEGDGRVALGRSIQRRFPISAAAAIVSPPKSAITASASAATATSESRRRPRIAPSELNLHRGGHRRRPHPLDLLDEEPDRAADQSNISATAPTTRCMTSATAWKLYSFPATTTTGSPRLSENYRKPDKVTFRGQQRAPGSLPHRLQPQEKDQGRRLFGHRRPPGRGRQMELGPVVDLWSCSSWIFHHPFGQRFTVSWPPDSRQPISMTALSPVRSGPTISTSIGRSMSGLAGRRLTWLSTRPRSAGILRQHRRQRCWS